MKFRIDKEFNSFCAMTGINQPATAAHELYTLAETRGVFSQTRDLYGAVVEDWLEDEMAAARVITEFTGQVCTVAHYNTFMHLTIVGEGNCPDCGGELEEIDSDAESLHDGNGICPDSIRETRYICRCKHCLEEFTFYTK